jgi:archaeosine synthase
VEFTVEDHPTTSRSLTHLRETLAGERTIQLREKEQATIQAIADYQFGAGAGPALFDDITLRGRYPKLQAMRDGEQLAAIVPQYGTLALTIAGGRAWLQSDVPTKRVQIDRFVPRGSVLAPGIVDADTSIRVGDEVVIEGPQAFGVGRATMHGTALAESTRGVGVDVRHVVER